MEAQILSTTHYKECLSGVWLHSLPDAVPFYLRFGFKFAESHERKMNIFHHSRLPENLAYLRMTLDREHIEMMIHKHYEFRGGILRGIHPSGTRKVSEHGQGKGRLACGDLWPESAETPPKTDLATYESGEWPNDK